MSQKSFTHLTFEDRQTIENGLAKGLTRTEIAARIKKDASTVSKEVRAHKRIKPSPGEQKCLAYSTCSAPRKKNGRGCTGCKSYIPFTCKWRDLTPGVCNGCGKIRYCKREIRTYNAKEAQVEYEETLVSRRAGVDATQEEFEQKKSIIVPLLKQGQSPYAIVTEHPELGICERTIYNWIEARYFAEEGFLNVDLPRKVSRKMTKKKSKDYKKRKDHTYLEGRKYVDYEAFMKDHPYASVMYMDTVYNNETTGPFIQTMKFRELGFFFAVYHEAKTSEEMLAGVLLLEECLGPSLFEKYAQVIVTDRGSEFVLAKEAEFRPDGTRRCHIFYCDPMASGQKGSLEQMHTVLRFFLPKKKDLEKLGLDSQDALSIIVSHMDSYVYKALKGKTPIQMAQFYWPDFWRKMQAFGIREIDPDDVTLKPSVLRKTIRAVVDEGATLEDLEEGSDADD